MLLDRFVSFVLCTLSLTCVGKFDAYVWRTMLCCVLSATA